MERTSTQRPVLRVILALLLGFAGAGVAEASIPEGDEAWALRAEVLDETGRAAPEAVWHAADLYREAISANPRNLEARWKLLRAFHFEAAFSSVSEAQRRAAIERAIDVSEVALEWLARRAGGDGLEVADDAVALRKLYPEMLREDAARIHFFSALIWERWAGMNGRLESVRRGSVGRLYDHTRIVVAIRPEIDAGGGYRLFARLHARTPRVPFVTGWVKRDEALAYAERALAVDPEHPNNRLLAAELRLELGADGPPAKAAPEGAQAHTGQPLPAAPVAADPREELRALADLVVRPEDAAEDYAVRRSARALLGMGEGAATRAGPEPTAAETADATPVE